MKGRIIKTAAAVALALLLVTGNVPIQPVADLFGSMAITASALDVSLQQGGDEWYVNMPKTGTDTLTLSDASVTTFKVYDDGGKNGKYSNNCKGTLTLTAPTDYVLQLSGNITTEKDYDKLTVYDGNTTSSTKLLDAISSTGEGTQTAITTVTSSGQSMTLYFDSDNGFPYAGLDLTVMLVSTSEKFGITVNSATGGSVAASVGGNSATKAKVNDVVTLTASPSTGYLLNALSVKDANNNDVMVTWDVWTNTATFTMPNSAVTVTPTFTNTWTADGGLYVNMPATGTNTLTIPSGVQSFKVYDDGGASGKYSNNCSGYLVLTAPTGYALQLSGSIETEKKQDQLTVYDGSTTSGTKLLDAVSSTSNGNLTAITTVTSNGKSMMLYFHSDVGWYYDGLDLTVTLVPSSPHSININTASGGTVTASVNNQSVISARIEDAVTLTATPSTGYVLSDISATDGSSNAVDIDWSIWANTATFTMPASAVTVTPTFTNDLTNLNINMPETGEQTATIPAGLQSFHVDYDYNISNSVSSKLTMTAPEGCLLQLSGTATMTGEDQAYFRVYDGDNVVSDSTLINSSSSDSYTGVVSSGNVMTIYCWTIHNIGNHIGKTWNLDITVNVVNANTSNGVTISNSITNGQVVSDKNTANINETVTLTATPAEGCVLQSINVTDGNGAISLTPSATDATWGDVSFYTANEFTFKMRSSDATVNATFMPKADFYVNMPKTDQRDFTIPDGTTSFKVYDNSGKNGGYFINDDGYLLLTAPDGYAMNVSGYVKLYYSSSDEDYLDIYDGNSISATSLGHFKDISGNNNTFTQTPVNAISSTNQMLLHFVTNDYGYVGAGGGVYLTVTLIPIHNTITIDDGITGGVVTADKADALEGDTVTLTVTPAAGYTLKSLTVNNTTVDTTSMIINNDGSYSYSFTMPDEDVTITAQFVSSAEKTTRFAGYSLSLKDDIGLNMYFDIPDDVKANVTKMVITVPDIGVKEIPVDKFEKDDTGYYKFRVNVAAKQMTDEVVCKLYTGDEEPILTKNASVREAAALYLRKPAEHDLVAAMLYYGGCSQRAFGYNEVDCADIGITYSGEEWVPVTFTRPDAADGISYYGTSLLFESKIHERHYFEITGNADEYTFTINGAPATHRSKTVSGQKLYYIDSDAIDIVNLGKPLVITVKKNGEEVMQYEYSPLIYIQLIKDNPSSYGDVWCKETMALYWYYKEAVKYTNNGGN